MMHRDSTDFTELFMSTSCRLIFSLAFAAALHAQSPVPEDFMIQISGTIRGQGAKGFEPLLAIPVYLTRVPENNSDTLAVNRLVNTDSLGRYTFDRLPPGRYRICPHSPRTTYLSPCDWSTDSQMVKGVPGSRTVTRDFTLERGVIVNIAVEDEDGELTKTGRAAGLEVTVQGARGPVQALEGAQLGRRKNMVIVVPKGRLAQIQVKTKAALQVDTDDQGARRPVSPAAGLSMALGQETVREVRFFVRRSGGRL
jgi:hypothetical protein